MAASRTARQIVAVMNIALGLRDWTVREHLAPLKSLFLRQSSSHRRERLVEWFTEQYRSPALAFNRARCGLQTALSLVHNRFPARTEVVIPVLACDALRSTIRRSGLTPVYADIQSDLNTSVSSVEALVGPKTLAIIMVHAYGLPADCEGFERPSARTGVCLIDDAAQVVWPPDRLGTFGAFGMLSFAQSKGLVTGVHGSGGILLLNDPAYREEANRCYQALPVAGDRLFAHLEFVFGTHSKALSYHFSRLGNRFRERSLQPAKISAPDVAIAAIQIERAEERYSRRLEHLQWYRRAFEVEKIAAPQLHYLGFLSRLFVLLSARSRDAVREALRRAGIESRLPYALPDEVTESSHPVAFELSRKLLELPLSSTLTRSQAEAVAREVRRTEQEQS